MWYIGIVPGVAILEEGSCDENIVKKRNVGLPQHQFCSLIRKKIFRLCADYISLYTVSVFVKYNFMGYFVVPLTKSINSRL